MSKSPKSYATLRTSCVEESKDKAAPPVGETWVEVTVASFPLLTVPSHSNPSSVLAKKMTPDPVEPSIALKSNTCGSCWFFLRFIASSFLNPPSLISKSQRLSSALPTEQLETSKRSSRTETLLIPRCADGLYRDRNKTFPSDTSMATISPSSPPVTTTPSFQCSTPRIFFKGYGLGIGFGEVIESVCLKARVPFALHSQMAMIPCSWPVTIHFLFCQSNSVALF